MFYFGEDVDSYDSKGKVSHGGSWHAGENGAHAGLMLPSLPLLGSRYYQEVAPKVAMDRAEIVSISESFRCPAGKLAGVLKTEEATLLESGREHKLYAPGVGLVKDDELELVRHGDKM